MASIFCHSRWEIRRLARLPALRPPIGQPLAIDALQRGNRALGIGYAKAGTMVVAEIELADVPLQVRLGNVVIGAHDAALQDREVIFDRVRMVELAANIFL